MILPHNIEETLTMATYLPALNTHLPADPRTLLGPVAAEQFPLPGRLSAP